MATSPCSNVHGSKLAKMTSYRQKRPTSIRSLILQRLITSLSLERGQEYTLGRSKKGNPLNKIKASLTCQGR
jgi:hypothetical protein